MSDARESRALVCYGDNALGEILTGAGFDARYPECSQRTYVCLCGEITCTPSNSASSALQSSVIPHQWSKQAFLNAKNYENVCQQGWQNRAHPKKATIFETIEGTQDQNDWHRVITSIQTLTCSSRCSASASSSSAFSKSLLPRQCGQP